MKSLASLSPLALVLVSLHLGGCAADVDDGEGPSEENVTAANVTSHGKAVRKCLDEEMTSTLNPDGAIAAADKSAKCVAAANDKLLSSIDARQGAATGTTKAKFATFRAKTETACLAFASTNGRPSLNRQADCLRDTEEGLARIFQSFGNLGGTRDSSLVFGSWGRMQETCFVKWSSTNDGGAKLLACIETGVKAETKAIAPNSAQPVTEALTAIGDLCTTLQKKKNTTTEQADVYTCRYNAALYVQSLQPS